MPIIKSAKKKLNQDKKRTKTNQPIKAMAQRAIISFRKNPNLKSLSKVYRLIDHAAKKKIFKKNKAARLKSRLTILLFKTQKQSPKKITEKTKKPKA